MYAKDGRVNYEALRSNSEQLDWLVDYLATETIEKTTRKAYLINAYNILNDKMSDDGDGITISFDDWQALCFDENSDLADELDLIFVGVGFDNYQLIEDSQCIDAGTDLVSDAVEIDFANNP
ncbi:MAG: hypothetical protein P8I55_05130 [Crocinitomix sp.]|nr:hypothetical protein [Crocinitomix sp.]